MKINSLNRVPAITKSTLVKNSLNQREGGQDKKSFDEILDEETNKQKKAKQLKRR